MCAKTEECGGEDLSESITDGFEKEATKNVQRESKQIKIARRTIQVFGLIEV